MRDDARPKLIQHVETALGQAIGAMAGQTYTVTLQDRAADAAPLEEPMIWQQSFSAVDRPSFWISAGKDLWYTVGKVTLEAAGLDSVTDEDCQSTWQEIVNQTAAGVATGLTADQQREVTVGKGEALDAEPQDVTWLTFLVTSGAAKWTFKAAWIRELQGIPKPEPEEPRSAVGRDSTVSKTFDLLLEVALPVCVSFGKTSLQIREVLKLNTGSIVELDRFVSDPVEVIVNDCIIARGEVVVVDGNYGVRINQLASREDRLRTGLAEPMHKGGRL